MTSIRKVAVIGAGNMGAGIAQKIAQEGFEVVMVDIEDKFVQNGLRNIRDLLKEAVERRIFTEEQTKEIIARVSGTTDYNELADVDLVIEAIFENMKVKKEVFGKLDGICKPGTIFVSNTSSLSISELAKAVKRSDRFAGLHYFYHPAKNRLVEVIPGKETSEETNEALWEFSKLHGKTPIWTADAPGFAVNRFFVPWLNEATRLLEEGVANIPTIDEGAKKAFKIGMGPFKLMNVTGIPIAYHSTVSLGGLGAFYGPTDKLKGQFESGEQWDLGSGEVDEGKFELVKERMLGVVFYVAAKLVEEGVASIEDTDRGAKIGLRWILGPFELMNMVGVEAAYSMAATVVDAHSDLSMPKMLDDWKGKGRPWKFKLVDLRIEGDIARLLINRPEAMNALNEEVMKQIDERFAEAEKDPKVKAVVLEGAGKAFVAGADIKFFIDKIKSDSIDDIVTFTRYGHEVLKRIDRSEKLVIAKLDGLSLGGGSELALAADTIVATERGTIGFPETGIGIYPGLGGTQRTARYIGKELAKYLVFTGRIVDAKMAKHMGLVQYISTPERIDGMIRELVDMDRDRVARIGSRDKMPVELIEIEKLFSDVNIEALLAGKPVGEGKMAQKVAKQISRKAPIALKLANKLIDEGLKGSLDEGIELELGHLIEIFSTKDALVGLRSVGKGRPEFKGE
jgi:enoyl-CoA hydratase/3-hydroxyacyl-CoA dehydrogenase